MAVLIGVGVNAEEVPAITKGFSGRASLTKSFAQHCQRLFWPRSLSNRKVSQWGHVLESLSSPWNRSSLSPSYKPGAYAPQGMLMECITLPIYWPWGSIGSTPAPPLPLTLSLLRRRLALGGPILLGITSCCKLKVLRRDELGKVAGGRWLWGGGRIGRLTGLGWDVGGPSDWRWGTSTRGPRRPTI